MQLIKIKFDTVKDVLYNKRFLKCVIGLETLLIALVILLRMSYVDIVGTLETKISVPFVGVAYNMANMTDFATAATYKGTYELQVLQIEKDDTTVESLDGVSVVGLYVDGSYLCAVTPDTVGELQRYFYNKSQELYAADNEIVRISFDKTLEFAPISDEIESAYIQNTDAVIEKLEANTIAYKLYEIKPTDTVASIANELNVSVDEVVSYVCQYNGNEVLDWSTKLIVGSKLSVPYEVPYINLQYSKYKTVEEYIPFETKEIYDDTMYDDELSVLKNGVDGKKSLDLLITYNLDGVATNKEVIRSEVLFEPQMSIVRVGTIVRVQKALYTKDTPEEAYVYPVEYAAAYISAYMGDGRGHKGLDIAAPYGTPIYAATAGIVSDVGTGWNGGYGNAVVIANDDGRTCRYAHMSWYVVSEGETVQKGQIIGYVGSTGNSSGNHLHFEVITSDGNFNNPLNYIYKPQ